MLRASGPATGAGAHKPRTAQVCRSQPPSQAAPSAPRDKPTSDSLNELRVPQLQRPTRLQPMNSALPLESRGNNRLQLVNQTLLDRLREEAAERAALQMQLAQAKAAATQAQLSAESAAALLEEEKREKLALEERGEVQGAHLSMMEVRLSRVMSEVQALEVRSAAAVEAQSKLAQEREKLTQQVHTLETQVQAQGAQHSQALLQTRADMQAMLEESQRRAQAAEEEKVAAGMALQQAALDLARAQRDAAEAVRAAAVLRQELTALATQQTQTDLTSGPHSLEYEAVQSHITALHRDLKDAQDTVRSLTTQLSDTQAELQRQAQQPPPTPTQDTSLQQRVQVLEMQLDSGERERRLEVALLMSNIKLAREQGLAAAAREAELQSEVSTLRSFNTVLERKTQQQAAHIEELRRANAQLTEERTALSAQRVAYEQMQGAHQALQERLTERETALSEATQRITGLSRRLEVTERVTSERVAAQRALVNTNIAARTPDQLPTDSHVTTNRYWSPPGLHFALIKCLALREAYLQPRDEFLAMSVTPQGEEVVVSVLWRSKQAFEQWSSDRAQQASLPCLPSGVLQYPVAKGEGVPEPYVPIKQ